MHRSIVPFQQIPIIRRETRKFFYAKGGVYTRFARWAKHEVSLLRDTAVKRLELIIAACLYYSGLVMLVRWWMGRTGPKLIILCYHHGSGVNFQQQLRYLNRSYRVLHLEAALKELYEPQTRGLFKHDRRTLLALTFDDGYHDNYSDGFATVREEQVPITLFLIPGYIESGKRYWWEEPAQLVKHAQVREVALDGRCYCLDEEKDRQTFMQVVEARLRLASSVAGREAFLAMVRERLGVSAQPGEDEAALLPVTWSEVCEMEKSGWVSFGGHTMHHPVLEYLCDTREIATEVCESRAILEKRFRHNVYTFAYPYGRTKHIGTRGQYAARIAGYKWAVTTIHGFNTAQTDPYLLRRILVGADQHWLVVAAKACGLWEFFLRRAARQEVLYG